jgi:hypothetical protein
MKNLIDLYFEEGIIRNPVHMDSGPPGLHVCFASCIESFPLEKKPQAHKQSKRVAFP